MTPEAQRIALAKLNGWSSFDTRSEYPGRLWGMLNGRCEQVPDYLNDLAAIQAAVREYNQTHVGLDIGSVGRYGLFIEQLCLERGGWIDNTMLDLFLEATPAEWCAAFLKVTGHWED